MRTITTTTLKADAAHQAVPEDITIPSRLRAGTIGDLTIRQERHSIDDIQAALRSTRTVHMLDEVEDGLRTAAGLLTDYMADQRTQDDTLTTVSSILERLYRAEMLPVAARLAILRDAEVIGTEPADARMVARLAWRLLDIVDTFRDEVILTIGESAFEIDARGPKLDSGMGYTAGEYADRLNVALAESPQQKLDELRTIEWLDGHIALARNGGNLGLVDHLDEIRNQVLAASHTQLDLASAA
ncbi:MAG: hypothetical protein JHD16_00120 [Solirubrobacteraceae bacterium]|nr:hypothetical protein [Solirubrobacteraceae bacterium]